MNKVIYKITDYYELINLHKALLEAKFHLNPDNELVTYSPIVANISNQIVDILTEYDESKITSWNEWRRLENQCFYKERAISNSKYIKYWKSFNYFDKVSCVKNLISPFITTDNDIKDMIDKIDTLHNTL